MAHHIPLSGLLISLLFLQLGLIQAQLATPYLPQQTRPGRTVPMAASLNLMDLISDFALVSDDIENQACKIHSRAYLKGVQDFTPWALKNRACASLCPVLDSGSKLQSGLLEGNIKNLGQYDECVEVRGQLPRDAERPAGVSAFFVGQYCLANVQVTVLPTTPRSNLVDQLINTMTLGRREREITRNRTIQNVPGPVPSLSVIQWAVCVPSSCSPRDVQLTLDRALSRLAGHVGLQVSAEVFPESCSVNTVQPWTRGELAMLFIIYTLVVLVCVGSTYDILRPPGTKPNTALSVLLAFSLPTNWSRLFRMDAPAPGAITSLDGIRVVNTLWVIVTHKVMYITQQPWSNKRMIIESLSHVSKMPLGNSLQNVDSFFLMSGLLKTYHNLKELDQGRFSLMTSIVKRYLRLTPPYAAMVAFYATLLHRMSTGPNWQWYVVPSGETCRQEWLVNMLYLNNYVNTDNWCMLQSWYLSADMQLFLLSPLFIYPLWRWPRGGPAVLAAGTLVSVIVPMTVTYLSGALPVGNQLGMPDQALLYFYTHFYAHTHNRMAPYLVGLGLGCLIYKLRDVALRLNKVTIVVGWCVSSAMLGAVLFGPFHMMQFDYHYHALEAALYGGLHRLVWGVGLAWVVFACHQGYGGWVNSALSARVWQPLSRLSYCIYLTHFAHMLCSEGRLRNAIYVDELLLLHGFVGDTFVSVMAALVLHLLVEAPFSELTNIFYRGKITVNTAVQHNGPDDKPKATNGVHGLKTNESHETIKQNGITSDFSNKNIEMSNVSNGLFHVSHNGFSDTKNISSDKIGFQLNNVANDKVLVNNEKPRNVKNEIFSGITGLQDLIQRTLKNKEL